LFYWFNYSSKANAISADEVKMMRGAGLSGIALGWRTTGLAYHRAGAPVAMVIVGVAFDFLPYQAEYDLFLRLFCASRTSLINSCSILKAALLLFNLCSTKQKLLLQYAG
jgi:hypothetical protein